MFNKLKSQLNEKSGSDIIPTVTSSNKSIRKNSEKALQRIKSNQSDGNHSSDDTSSLKSQKINYENVSDENRETINNVNIDLNNSLNSSTISENKKDDSLKSQLQELNQSLLKEIDKLHAIIDAALKSVPYQIL
ncbi:unnamed protein product [Brachionus calyciflorus]|uniref:Uncharacterized protein n=1 Tax=Brachionus calyciflorus TaxID=104777 RepID=A0A814BUE2_9BILA|nr:unnamed protein product [Brachionus calyciflorus]